VAFVRVGVSSADVNPFGPVHAYVAPLTLGVDSEIVAPAQYGPPFDAVGVAGAGLTTTLVEPAADAQPFTVTVTEYVPASAVVAFVRVGVRNADVNPFGPVHEYVALLTVGVDSEMVPPAQYGPVFDAVGVAGIVLTTTLVEPAEDVHPLTVTVTEYAPASAVVAFVRAGVRSADVNPFGPVQAYVAPLTVGVDSEIVPPSQYGPVFDAVGVEGTAFTVTTVGADGALVQPEPSVTVTV
jgi:hypothetical protein